LQIEGLELREKCGQANERGCGMKIGIVISGGDVSGINNFIFQIARLASADITLFNGGIPGLLDKNHQDIAWRDLVDFPLPLFRSLPPGEPAANCCAVNMKALLKNLNLCALMC
jgi:6-phosphofructokinase 1